ncbi:TPA: AraC family transcriptional regulator [Pseudomonas putida]
MTPLDKLISLAGVRGSMDLRCQFSGRWAVNHEPDEPGTARYHIVLAGHCHVRLPDRQTVRLKAGDILLFTHGSDHLLQSDTDHTLPSRPDLVSHGVLPLHRLNGKGEPLDLLCGRFLYQPGSSLFAALPEHLHVNINDPHSPTTLPAMIALIRSEAEASQPGGCSIINGLTTALFTLVLRAWLDASPPVQSSLGLLGDRRLSKVWHALLEDPSQPWSVERMAEMANMSRASFVRSFTRLAGCPPGALVLQVRMEVACMLLAKSEQALNDIALQVGYQTQASFSKAFKETLGRTPGQYRRERQSDDLQRPLDDATLA